MGKDLGLGPWEYGNGALGYLKRVPWDQHFFTFQVINARTNQAVALTLRTCATVAVSSGGSTAERLVVNASKAPCAKATTRTATVTIYM